MAIVEAPRSGIQQETSNPPLSQKPKEKKLRSFVKDFDFNGKITTIKQHMPKDSNPVEFIDGLIETQKNNRFSNTTLNSKDRYAVLGLEADISEEFSKNKLATPLLVVKKKHLYVAQTFKTQEEANAYRAKSTHWHRFELSREFQEGATQFYVIDLRRLRAEEARKTRPKKEISEKRKQTLAEEERKKAEIQKNYEEYLGQRREEWQKEVEKMKNLTPLPEDSISERNITIWSKIFLQDIKEALFPIDEFRNKSRRQPAFKLAFEAGGADYEIKYVNTEGKQAIDLVRKVKLSNGKIHEEEIILSPQDLIISYIVRIVDNGKIKGESGQRNNFMAFNGTRKLVKRLASDLEKKV